MCLYYFILYVLFWIVKSKFGLNQQYQSGRKSKFKNTTCSANTLRLLLLLKGTSFMLSPFISLSCAVAT